MRLTVALHASGKTTNYSFDQDEVTIGRDPANQLALPPAEHLGVGTRHARLICEGSRVFVEDLQSRNGTWVDGTRIANRVQIHPGQEISLGQNGPRLSISIAVPATVAEMLVPGTVAEGPNAVPLPPLPAHDATGVTSPARSSLGQGTVVRMIDEALARARESDRGKLVRQTIFVQEIVKLATRESRRELRLAMSVLAAVLLVVFGFVFFQINRVRNESRAARLELTNTYRSGLDSVQQALAAQQKELESRQRAYDQAAVQMRNEMETLVSGAAATDDVRRLAAELDESRKRYASLAGAIEELQLKRDATLSPAPETRAAVAQAAEGIKREEQRQRELTEKIAGEASRSQPGGVDLAKLRELNVQMLEAQSASSRLAARIDRVATAREQTASNEEKNIAEFGKELQQKNEVAVLDRMAELERAVTAAPASGVAPLVTAQPAALVNPISPVDRSHLFSKPYPRANLKKRIAVGRFECLVANNPWGVSRDDVERQMRSQMTTILRDIPQFHVVERQDLMEVLDEQKLAQTGAMTERSTAPAGALLGAQAIILGKITKLDVKVEERKSTTNWGALISSFAGAAAGISNNASMTSLANQIQTDPNLSTLQTHSENVDATFTIQIDFKVLDTTTGEVLLTTTGHGVGRSSASARSAGTALVKGGSARKEGDHLGDGTRQALLDATVKIMEKMERVPWRGSVMDRDDEHVILNGGKDVGLQEGDTFQVMSRGKELIDPESGQRRGFIEKPAGMVRVSSVAENRSDAEVVDLSLPFKAGDSLVYVGATRSLRPGESSDAAPDEKPAQVRYAVIRGEPMAFAGPGSSQARVELRELTQGSPLLVRFQIAEWVKVTLPSGGEAWMPESALVMREEPPTSVSRVAITNRKAALRSSPSTKGRKLEVLRRGDTVSVTERLGDWYHVKSPGGVAAWISASEVTASESSGETRPAGATS
jgi:curli biogenesis system outer membrane secretion channel CsgG/SH3-like domain-containing protein